MRIVAFLVLAILAFLLVAAGVVAQEAIKTPSTGAETTGITLSGSLSFGGVFASSSEAMPYTGATVSADADIRFLAITLGIEFIEEMAVQVPVDFFGELVLSAQYDVLDMQIGETFLVDITSGPGCSTDLRGFSLSWTIDANGVPATTTEAGWGGFGITSTLVGGPPSWAFGLDTDLEGHYELRPFEPGGSSIVLSGGMQTEFPGPWISPWVGIEFSWGERFSASAVLQIEDVFGSIDYVIDLAFGANPWETRVSMAFNTRGGLLLEGGLSWNWDISSK